MFNSPFTNNVEKIIESIQNCNVVFVSDMFAEDYPGGAELTTEALITSNENANVAKIRSSELTMDMLSAGVSKYWIFTNFASMNKELIPSIIANLKYSVVEYDFKYCSYRSPEKHHAATGEPCDCETQPVGKMISAFFYAAQSLFWMSDQQRERYEKIFPFLSRKRSVLLSSIFDKKFFEFVSENEREKNEKYIIVGSESWIKGVEDSVAYCEENDIEYEVVSGVSHNELLVKMAESKGMIFLPRGGDTCPRTVIEAKLLGCELIINENVMHKDEEWFASDNPRDTVEWLMTGPSRFWEDINRELSRQPTISGYTTTLNCINQNYPFEASISSLIGFCDQVVIVDGGSTDGTIEKLREIESNNENVIVHVQERDWDSKRFAVFDGLQKGLARAMCTGEFCWQQDSDEVVHERDYDKIKKLTKDMPKSMDLVALPVIEFWGRKGKVRIDVNPWKWRLSRNRPHITHGIPRDLRVFDDNGELYSKPGSDGCDYVRSDTYEPIPFVNFYSEEANTARSLAMRGDTNALSSYSGWLEQVVNSLPSVVHYSWYDIERKIKTYKNYWSKHWQSLYDIEQEDTVENNMFFDKTWADVTDSDIEALASKLETELGGHIFHTKVNFEKPTPWLPVDDDIHPELISGWLK